MINKLLFTLTSIKGFIFFVIGVLWVVSPYDTGANFGILTIPEGMGRSILIGDIGSYFFCIGTMMMLAAYTLKSIWFYAPAMLLSITALFRIISWGIHDATFATQFIAVEILIVTLLLITSKRTSNN